MKRIIIYILTLLLTIPWFSVFVSAASKPDKLVNSLYKLQKDKNFTIGYFGGSVTAGTGASDTNNKSWRGITREWFKKEFPGVTVNEVNASIGGTGSVYGLYRADADLIKSKAPDLVFIEFAINDMYDKIWSGGLHNATTNVETIIKKIYASNPKSDIVFIITGDRDRIASKSFGNAYEELAGYYNLPIIYVGRKLAEYMNNNGGIEKNWSTYFSDIVHPTDKGHSFYADTIIEYLNGQLKNGYTASSADYVDKPQPKMSFSSKNSRGKLYLDAHMESNSEVINDYKKYNSATFEFEGTAIGFWAYCIKDNVTNIRYRIDGGSYKNLEVVLQNESNYKLYFLDSSLSNEKRHTLEISHVSGSKLNIQHFLIAGAKYTGNAPGVVGPNDNADTGNTNKTESKKVEKPTFTISNNGNGELTIKSQTEGASIYYTTDGSEPKSSESRLRYKESLTFSKDCIIKAYAKKSGMIDSEVAVYNFKVGNKGNSSYSSETDKNSVNSDNTNIESNDDEIITEEKVVQVQNKDNSVIWMVVLSVIIVLVICVGIILLIIKKR